MAGVNNNENNSTEVQEKKKFPKKVFDYSRCCFIYYNDDSC